MGHTARFSNEFDNWLRVRSSCNKNHNNTKIQTNKEILTFSKSGKDGNPTNVVILILTKLNSRKLTNLFKYPSMLDVIDLSIINSVI